MKRFYQSIIEEHLRDVDQMAFMPGPRQAGKTTIVRDICDADAHNLYLNWDFPVDREIILSGADRIIARVNNPELGRQRASIVAFDEIHKFKSWKISDNIFVILLIQRVYFHMFHYHTYCRHPDNSNAYNVLKTYSIL